MRDLSKLFFMLLLTSIIILNLNNYSIGKNLNSSASKFEESSKGYNIIRYSNVILKLNGKIIKVPIYGGIYEDITYEELQKQQKKKNYLFNLFIPTSKGKVEDTFNDILKFYKNSFFKNVDVNKPSVIGNEGAWIIWYDFEYNDLPCSMMISIGDDEQSTQRKKDKLGFKRNNPTLSIDMLGFDEDSPGIGLEISIGEPSPFKKK